MNYDMYENVLSIGRIALDRTSKEGFRPEGDSAKKYVEKKER